MEAELVVGHTKLLSTNNEEVTFKDIMMMNVIILR